VDGVAVAYSAYAPMAKIERPPLSLNSVLYFFMNPLEVCPTSGCQVIPGAVQTSVSGSDYWMFDGELLDERRIRFEATQLELQATT
jgi:hypothetical protein